MIPLTSMPLRFATTECASSWARREARNMTTATIATAHSAPSTSPPVSPNASRPAMTSTDQWMPTSTPKIRPIRTLDFIDLLPGVRDTHGYLVQRYDPSRTFPSAARNPLPEGRGGSER